MKGNDVSTVIKHPRFLDLVHAGLVPADAIDDYIADWHDGPSAVSLHVFLGMTWLEYARWAELGVLPTEAEHHRVPQQDVVFTGPPEMRTPLYVHGPSHCRPVCPIHWPSDHPQATWPLEYYSDLGIMARLCLHGFGHPDPDDQNVRLHPELAEHECDGCCRPTVDGEFYEEDEPVADVLAAYDRGAKGITGRPA